MQQACISLDFASNNKKGSSFMAVTIRDVAALAGVSPATVSRTCNNNPAISAETRERSGRPLPLWVIKFLQQVMQQM